ncbi:sigma 54-interacting transcriptional regulator [Clostridium akagii]|uniref:sigma 54-interacting transcriptional regulator n=1 Tax=Clostridium akagii TaxID=91623 RepID=UPI00047AF656|nr:sigma 54-interacting transcriptional regulator [Clostridium akagii]
MILKKIQRKLIEYLDIISGILDVNMRIVDNKFNIIAGSGSFKDNIDINLKEDNCKYKKIFSTGEINIIGNPQKDDICAKCSYDNNCTTKFEMCAPIILNNQIIGIIQLVCLNEKQREKIEGNLNNYIVLLKYLSQIISEKVSENVELQNSISLVELLNIITEEINEAVVIMDKYFHISYSNKKANDILGIYDRSSFKMNIDFTGNYIMESKEYKVLLHGDEYFLVGSLNDTQLEERYKQIFVFYESKVVKNNINRMVNIDNEVVFDSILGTSSNIINIKKSILKISDSTSTILITGESGVGKDTLARAIHRSSYRKKEAFIEFDCSNIGEQLMERELLGYTANNGRYENGKLQLANKGTIFFHNIDEMPLDVQAKLLRALKTQDINIISEEKLNKIDIRVISGTDKNIEEIIKNQGFIEELYYYLSAIPIAIMPLRERTEDIKLIVYNFSTRFAKLFNKKFIGVDGEVWEYLLKYNWPGNTSELRSTVEFMISIMDSSGIITKEMLPKRLAQKVETENASKNGKILSLKHIEKQAIKNALSIYGFSTEGKKIAATKLGIGIATLYRKIEEYKIIKG